MVETGLCAEIIVGLAARKTDHVFHYAIPGKLKDVVHIGSRVLVPFRERRLAGYVIGFGQPDREVNIREIAGVLDEEPVFSPELLELARWMSENYLCSTAEALQRIISPRLQVKQVSNDRLVVPALAREELERIVLSMSRAPKQAAVLQAAMNSPGLSVKELAAAAKTSGKTVELLIDRGYLTTVKKTSPAAPGYAGRHLEAGEGALRLNADQAKALDSIEIALKGGKFHTFLLHGVTGSGKTEVYLRAIAAALQEGRQAITLVPEIALTPQMIELFKARFGNLIAVLHSGLSKTARYQAWQRVKSGEAPVVLGTRSAVFAPVPRPGLFVIDEEHESTYKQGDHLRYHAREIALKRAQQSGSVVILGSATPSMESYLKAMAKGPYSLLELPVRIDNHPLPPVRVVDMRSELKHGNRGIFSLPLVEAINRRLDGHEQVILFLNRRGYANFVVCRACGLVLKCPHCDISLTYHLDGRLRCHYCNYGTSIPVLCPGCGSKYIRHFGIGTQKVEEEARRLFPGANVLRIDSDTTSRRGSHERLIASFRDGQSDILIGTQMIAKGLDLPKVTLVGVINADTTLYMPDFRAAERTFQLLTQVAGRAGRGGLAGEVLIQTYTPEHYSIKSAAAHDFSGFYRSELPVRQALGYPPFSHLARLLLTHKDEETLKKSTWSAKKILEGIVAGYNGSINVLGPAPAPLSRIKGQFRWQLILKGPRRNTLKEVIKEFLKALDKERPVFKPSVQIDINPQSML